MSLTALQCTGTPGVPRLFTSKAGAESGPVLEVLDPTLIHRREIFTGDGVTAVFSVTNGPIHTLSEQVFLAGQGYQENGTHYVSDETSIQFGIPPLAGEKIVVYFQQADPNQRRIEPDRWPNITASRQGGVHRRELFTGDGDLTTWTLEGPIDGESEQIHSGLFGYYERGVHYAVAVDRKTLTFTLPPLNGEKLACYYFEANS